MFRGKSLENNEWVYGWFISYNFGGTIEEPQLFNFIVQGFIDHCQLSDRLVEVYPDSIAMNTGQKDKNDKQIYGSIEIDGKMTKGGDKIMADQLYGWVEPRPVIWLREGCWNIHCYTNRCLEIIGTQYDEVKK